MTTAPPCPPDRDTNQDPDFDELWTLAHKLSQLLDAVVNSGGSLDDALVAVGYTADEARTLHLTARERSVLAAIDRSAQRPEPVPV